MITRRSNHLWRAHEHYLAANRLGCRVGVLLLSHVECYHYGDAIIISQELLLLTTEPCKLKQEGKVLGQVFAVALLDVGMLENLQLLTNETSYDIPTTAAKLF